MSAGETCFKCLRTSDSGTALKGCDRIDCPIMNREWLSKLFAPQKEPETR